jgi:TRAP-type C4-dicarboxylate transport system permease small subunit
METSGTGGRSSRIVRSIVGYGGVAALALATWQMSERYIFPELGSNWADEAVIYIIGWCTFLCVALLVRIDKHIRADLVVRALPLKAQRAIEFVNSLLGLLFCLVLGWYGYLLTLDAFITDERSVTGSAFPIWIFYASLPVGMLLTVIWYGRRLFQLLFAFNPKEFSIRSGHDA